MVVTVSALYCYLDDLNKEEETSGESDDDTDDTDDKEVGLLIVYMIREAELSKLLSHKLLIKICIDSFGA